MERGLDHKGRWRNVLVGFRVSQEESMMINRAVALSGLSKQDYIIKKLLNRDVIVQGNPKVYKALKMQMNEIYQELQRVESITEVSDELLETIQMVATTLNELKK